MADFQWQIKFYQTVMMTLKQTIVIEIISKHFRIDVLDRNLVKLISLIYVQISTMKTSDFKNIDLRHNDKLN